LLHEEYVGIVNIYASHVGIPNFIKQMPVDIKT
jgi:hypothetical protein